MENEDMRFKRNQKSFPRLFDDIDFFKLTIPVVMPRATIFLLLSAYPEYRKTRSGPSEKVGE
jgi:hypothetical protein